MSFFLCVFQFAGEKVIVKLLHNWQMVNKCWHDITNYGIQIHVYNINDLYRNSSVYCYLINQTYGPEEK